jgi:integrase
VAVKFAKLTRPAVRALTPGGKIAEHGIIAECRANGDVRYSVNVMVDRQRIHRVVGRESDGVTREQAERLIEKLRTEAREERLDLPTGRKLHRTVAEAATDYLIKMEESGGKDLKNKRRHLEQHLVPHLGTERLDKLSTFGLQIYRKKRVDAGAKDATVNREFSTLQHLLNRAASKGWKWVKREDVPEIPKAREERKKIHILTAAQQDRLLKGAIADQDGRCWLFVMFGMNCAMRHSEIVCRRYDEIDFDNCRIWIDKAKAGERQQPITIALRDALLRQRQMEQKKDKDSWIFPAARVGGKTPHRGDMRAAFARAVVRAGLNPAYCTPHVMRHTAITALVKQKVDVPTIQKISGHKTPAMVLHYVHIFGEHIDDAISGLSISDSGTVTPELHTAVALIPDAPANAIPPKRRKSAA